jgi:hypothetical protein
LARSSLGADVSSTRVGRGTDVGLTFLVFAAGGFVLALAALVAAAEVLTVFGALRGDLTLEQVVLGLPIAAVLATVYGFGFMVAYLSLPLIFAATVAAAAAWHYGRVPAACLMALLVICPMVVLAQVSTLGVQFDPGAETEAEALTSFQISVRAFLVCVPALVGPWFVVRQRQIARRCRAEEATTDA